MQNHRTYRFARLATMTVALYSFTTLHSTTWTGGVKMEDRTAAENPYQTTIERLNRGLVAVCTDEGVFLSWRILATDTPNCAFDIYRDGKKISNTPITTGNYIDRDGNRLSRYEVKEGKEGRDDHALTRKEQGMEGFMSGCRDTVTGTGQAKCVTPWANEYLTLNISRPADGYTPGDCSVADVDADGSYELILKWDPKNAHDNSHGGVTDAVFIDCYDIADCQPASDLLKWRINLGRNIRAGAHYTQFLVYDFDGDGRAEIACKTAPGTVDGKGVPVLLPGDSADADYVCREGRLIGRITGGPEYLTVFSGETGEALATVSYTPAYADLPDWGDDYFNRSERYLACVAVLGDGAEEPEVPERSRGTEMTGRRGRASMVFCRGYYTQANLAAYDFDGKNITLRW
ncbi:MAG: hypothetical protein HUK08_02370, partial [Bacteroidaceae bacterium]|nr:hypothetical protein [Bacteroidaceae bacterium]